MTGVLSALSALIADDVFRGEKLASFRAVEWFNTLKPEYDDGQCVNIVLLLPEPMIQASIMRSPGRIFANDVKL